MALHIQKTFSKTERPLGTIHPYSKYLVNLWLDFTFLISLVWFHTQRNPVNSFMTEYHSPFPCWLYIQKHFQQLKEPLELFIHSKYISSILWLEFIFLISLVYTTDLFAPSLNLTVLLFLVDYIIQKTFSKTERPLGTIHPHSKYLVNLWLDFTFLISLVLSLD